MKDRNRPVAPLQQTFQKALALHQSGRIDAARTLYREVLAAEPRHFDSLHLLGLTTVQSGETEAGVALIRAALMVRPDVAEACYNLGNALLTLKRPAEALDSFNRALQINPSDAQCQFETGNALNDLKRTDEAILRYDEAIRLDPRYAEAHNNRGIALKDAGRFEEAVTSYDTAIALRPRYAEAHSNRGNALKELARFEEALACHDRAISLKPDYAEAHYNRGNVLGDLKRYEAALGSYDQALILRPDYAEARHNKALLLLGRGRLREGFELYPARWQTASFVGGNFRGKVPRWDGRTQQGQLLLWGEQGVGDEIFHASLLPLVPQDGIRITVAADKRLHAIFRRSFPYASVIDSSTLAMQKDADYTAQAPVGDLGGILGLDAEMLAARQTSFLRVDEARRETLRKAPGFPERGPVVGLSWKSSNKKFGAEKSLRLSDLAPILSVPGVSFVNLQYGEVAAEIAEAREAFGISVHEVQGLDVFNDIDGLLALIDACDVVVTTSNVTAHLAGSIGKKAVVLVPAGKGCLWYWQGGSNDLWYPSLTRLAQQRVGDWGGAIAAAARHLTELP
jgi:tetratricopeptide (TPR) repeat protein